MYGSRSEIIAIIVLIVLLAIIGAVIYETWQQSKETAYEQCISPDDHWPVGGSAQSESWDIQSVATHEYPAYDAYAETARDTTQRHDSQDAAYRLWQQRIAHRRGISG